MRVQHLVHVPLRCDAVAASKTQALEDDGSQHLVVADGAPQHEAGPAPGVVFHDTVVSIAVTSSSPYPNTPIGMVNAETAFIAEKHVLPANIVPVEVVLRPLQACLSMAHDGPENDTEVDGPSPFITFNGTQMMTLTCHATVNPAVDYDWLGVECPAKVKNFELNAEPRPASHGSEGRDRKTPLNMSDNVIQIDLMV
nr:hypothetical protein BaRGS_010637 [Batillaria attramentaria]